MQCKLVGLIFGTFAFLPEDYKRESRLRLICTHVTCSLYTAMLRLDLGSTDRTRFKKPSVSHRRTLLFRLQLPSFRCE